VAGSGALYITKGGAKASPTLPGDAITRTFGVLGQRGTGKTTTAVVLVEAIVKHGGYAAILDPVGAWYGITRAGERPGARGVVVGGEHGDVPLEETGGQLVADLVVRRQWPVVVIDMKLLRKGQQIRFMADFAETLFHSNRAPLHVVFEEADRALPQSPRGMDPTVGRLLGAGEDIVKLGRSRGLGATLVTQRPATVNKNVLEQVEGLIIHRLLGPNDRKAIKSWIEANGDPRATAQVMDSLASLGLGEAWLYSPALGLLDRATIRPRWTFDSSATPDAEPAAIEARTARAPVDLDVLRKAMAETVERAKANDPRELRRRIAELEARIEEVSSKSPAAAEPVEVEVLVPDREQVTALVEAQVELRSTMDEADDVAVRFANIAQGFASDAARASDAIARLQEMIDRVGRMGRTRVEPASALGRRPSSGGSPAPARRASVPQTRAANGAPSAKGSVNLSGPQQRVLDAIAWLEAVGFPEPSKIQTGFMAGYRVGKRVGGTFGNVLGQLRSLELIDYPSAGAVQLTPAGRAAAEMPAIERTTRGLQDAIFGRLSATEQRVLQVLVDAYPRRGEEEGRAAPRAGYSVGDRRSAGRSGTCSGGCAR
jgi:hypothetical protein